MTTLLKSALLAAAGLLFAFAPAAHADTTIQGAGSTFVAPIMAKWIQVYNQQHPDVKIDYQAIGSGGGIHNLTDKTIQFAGSDAPMTDDQLKQAGAAVLHLPEVAGPVVMSYNLPQLKNKLVLDGKTIAGIYLGTISHWNDPQIAALNPGANLPNLPILVAHRSEGSGTTYIFTGYLSQVSADWKSKVGQNTSVSWPTGRGGKGSDGVAAIIKNTAGAIGYVEYAYAINGHLPVASLQNKDGKPVDPSIDGVVAASKAVVADLPADFRLPIIDPTGPDAYPISGFTYLIIYKDLGYLKDRQKALQTVKFLQWILTDGQQYAEGLQYAKLGDDMRNKVLDELKQATFDGQPLLKD
ncbi:MAG TPA: phosphate ABC transporter substrate-binding protein PstS [Phycisphaerae bacterium]|nr:phosphate ABC transporter substrate-binding protein PstS [Phycisphaerae bacterium]